MKEKKYPVAEIFGPTVQGEGYDQGVACHFVRFGGCDYSCSWCDTPHAVLPNAVRHTERLTASEIAARVGALQGKPRWVILSGGNPALHDLAPVMDELGQRGFYCALETQGSMMKRWFVGLDRLCLSPKPPSSGMTVNMEMLDKVVDYAYQQILARQEDHWAFLKVVVFDHADYEWAKMIHLRYPGIKFYLSAGNDAGKTVGNPSRIDERSVDQVRNDLANKARWLVNRSMVDPVMKDVTVQSQFHVMLWGNELGR